MISRSIVLKSVIWRSLSQKSGGAPKTRTGGTRAAADISANVTGLSSKCVQSVTGKVGPGAASDGEYKVPEYFSYNPFTFTEAELEMAKFRCPQPSALKKQN